MKNGKKKIQTELQVEISRFNYILINMSEDHEKQQKSQKRKDQRDQRQDQSKKNKHRDRSRSREKHRHKDRDRDSSRHDDYSRHRNRDNYSRDNYDRDNYSRDNYDRNKRDNYNYNHRSYDRSRNNNYNNDRNYNRYDQGPKQRPSVVQMQVQLPKIYVLQSQSQMNSNYKIGLHIQNEVPLKKQENRLGELKNKITPIQKLWTSHIKQYLNISEFVQIYRKNKSLAYGSIQYGKSIINYQERINDLVYDPSDKQTQVFSRAYFKLWEILQLNVLQPFKNIPLKIGCVAEGPGGFIHALIDYRIKQHKNQIKAPQDIINAITLKIDNSTRNAKDWSDFRGKNLFQRMRDKGFKISLSYGKTGTGDLLLRDNIEYFQGQVGEKCHLVTGDGGIECIGDRQYEYQQVFNSKLFLGEIITAFHIQAEGGTFILKIYDTSFDLTRQLIILLTAHYRKVSLVKPITSRPGNSQKYILCEGFRGVTQQQLEDLKKLLENWRQTQPKISYFQNSSFAHNIIDFSDQPYYEQVYRRIKESNDDFMREQEEKLEEGLALGQTHPDPQSIEKLLREKRFQEQVSFAYGWCKKYRISAIEVMTKQKSQ